MNATPAIKYATATNTMSFTTGDITLPQQKGLYVVASGCGSGKTTMIRGIALAPNTTSMLIVVPTILCADDLYSDLSSKAISLGKTVAALHSGDAAISLMKQYRDDPNVL